MAAALAMPVPPWYAAAVAVAEVEEDDVSCVSAMARGDSTALGRLYDRHAPLLLGVVGRIVRDPTAAEDIVHDVFVEAWRRAADYDATRGKVRTWLALRARSRALDHRKSAEVSRRVAVDGASHWERMLGASSDADGAERSRLRALLVGLPEEQRDTLLLGYFEGLSSSEIAERMGVPIGTVKSRVATALGRLRKGLSPSEDA